MAKKETDPRLIGSLLLIGGIGLEALTLYMAFHDKKFFIYSCIAGPLVIPLGLGMAILPQSKMYKPFEGIPEGEPIRYNRQSLTTTAALMLLVGALVGVAQALVLGGFIDIGL